jgi:membrane protein DedA with SNARE-associated domain
MSPLNQFLLSHGGLVLFLAVFAEQSGLPFPAAPWLLLVDAFSLVFYAAMYVVLGFSFHRHLEQMVGFPGKLGVIALVLLPVAVGAYLGCAILKRSSKRPPNLSQHHSLNVIS